jgi:hypothetical protein
MSGCYAYCVMPAGALPPAGLRGIDGAAVTAHDTGGIALWVSTLPAPPDPDLERIRSHNAVVEAACDRRVTPVPLRFGQWLPDAAALGRHAAERAAGWRDQLDRFAGCCEMGVLAPHVSMPPARDVQSRTGALARGRAHMEELAARHGVEAAARARGEEIAARLRERLGAVLLRERVDAARPVGISIAHLVRWTDEPAYRDAVRAVSARIEGGLTMTGPWPPYSFVE